MEPNSEPVAIVTGGGKRVGRSLAEWLLGEGWTVVAQVRRSDDPVPDGAIRVAVDLADPGCGERILSACPDVPKLLVNNAARFAHDDLDSFRVEEFGAHMAVNVRAPALLTAAFARAGEGAGSERRDRLIVNLLDAKLAAPNPDFLSYTLSKTALAGLTELSARSLAARGIRVNAIAPALMLHSAGQSADNFAAAHAHNPLGRGVEVKDVVAALRYLLDSKVVTGEVLTLDGGQRFMALSRDVQFMDLDR